MQLFSCFSTDFETSEKTEYTLNIQQANKRGNTIWHAVFTQQIKFIGGSRVRMLSYERNPEHSCGYVYRWTAVSMGNTFQDLPQLWKTVDNTERCI